MAKEKGLPDGTVVCRLRPDKAAEPVTRVIVYKTAPNPKGKGPPIRSIQKGNFDTNDDQLSIGDACGAGTFNVAFYEDSPQVAFWSEPFTIEETTRSTGHRGIVNQNTANETQHGWVTIPGLTPATNAMLFATQQQLIAAKEDARLMVSQMTAIYDHSMKVILAVVEKQAEQSAKESADVTVFRTAFEKLTLKLEERDKALVELEKKALGLEVKAKNKEPEESTLSKVLEIANSPIAKDLWEELKGLAGKIGSEVAEEGKKVLREQLARNAAVPVLNEPAQLQPIPNQEPVIQSTPAT